MKMRINDKILNKITLAVVILIAVISLIDILFDCNEHILQKTIPFKVLGNKIIETSDDDFYPYIYWDIVEIDSTDLDLSYIIIDGEDRSSEVEFFKPVVDILINYVTPYIIDGKEEVTLKLFPPESEEAEYLVVKTVNTVNLLFLFKLIGTLVLFTFVVFNSVILLIYNNQWENRLIIPMLILLFLPFPDMIFPEYWSKLYSALIVPFWGLFFYHYVVIKAKLKKRIVLIYSITAIIVIFLSAVAGLTSATIIGGIWTIIWFINGYRILRKQYKLHDDNVMIKRLYFSFRGLEISLLSIIIITLIVFLIGFIGGLMPNSGINEAISNNLSISIAMMFATIVFPFIATMLGIVWFLGSFTWSLLTGTVMDIAIRSTLIYSMVGITFVIIFGMLDYMLGELLQEVFGNFIGSQFIAGFPATISLLIFFNPVRNKIESVVDRKLNNSQLKFLESADSFTKDLSEEGVLEGFEEYICENLFEKLSVAKIALIAFDLQAGCYRFNEIRGSNVVENSVVEDRFSYLAADEVVKVGKLKTESIQDIGSFSLLIPIISEDSTKWWLALGKRKENIGYSKRDIEALLKLANQIKLSLKFILVYEDIVEGKYLNQIAEKDDQLLTKESEIKQLKSELKLLTYNRI